MTVTQVKVAHDLKIAKIYVSFLGNKKTIDELMLVLKNNTKLIRHYVGLGLELKYIPKLRFYHDDTMQYAEKINKLINRIHHDD